MTIRFLTHAGLAFALIILTAIGASAADRRTFDEKAFAEAQAQGKSILIDISAPWCPTCQAQKPIIEKLAAEPRYGDLTIFDVDFDSRKDVLRKFRAQSQSTLIVFKGANEAGRSVGSTNESAIDSLLRKAL
ncbi:MAG: thioredoxin family protein [Hyphomicrobium sp.]|uniref:thioredoxin family protein n=1 Tax=Hyphomicrobium sp. TaxID=82 RepID=UPI0039E4BECB